VEAFEKFQLLSNKKPFMEPTTQTSIEFEDVFEIKRILDAKPKINLRYVKIIYQWQQQQNYFMLLLKHYPHMMLMQRYSAFGETTPSL